MPIPGSSEVPTVVHVRGRPSHCAHRTAGAPPPRHQKSTGQTVAVGEVDPAGQKEPGAALQGPEQEGEERPSALPKVPAGQSVGLTEARGQ